MCSRIITILLSTLIALSALPGGLHGQSVVSSKKRGEVIKLGEAYIDRSLPDWEATLNALEYPFSFVLPQDPVEEAQPVIEEAAPVAPPKPELTPRQILDEVATKINATGIVQRGEVTYLIVSGGLISEKSTIRINYEGKPYVIQVEDASNDGYTLRLQNETVRKSFGQKSSGSIERTQTP